MFFRFEKRFGNVFPNGSCSVNKSLDTFYVHESFSQIVVNAEIYI